MAVTWDTRHEPCEDTIKIRDVLTHSLLNLYINLGFRIRPALQIPPRSIPASEASWLTAQAIRLNFRHFTVGVVMSKGLPIQADKSVISTALPTALNWDIRFAHRKSIATVLLNRKFMVAREVAYAALPAIASVSGKEQAITQPATVGFRFGRPRTIDYDGILVNEKNRLWN